MSLETYGEHLDEVIRVYDQVVLDEAGVVLVVVVEVFPCDERLKLLLVPSGKTAYCYAGKPATVGWKFSKKGIWILCVANIGFSLHRSTRSSAKAVSFFKSLSIGPLMTMMMSNRRRME